MINLGDSLSNIVEHACDFSFQGALHVTAGSERQLVFLELGDKRVALSVALRDSGLLLHLPSNIHLEHIKGEKASTWAAPSSVHATSDCAFS